MQTLQRRWFFRPLSLALAFLLLPRLPIVDRFSGVPEAKAQAVYSCTPSSGRIIQQLCDTGTPGLALVNFENQVVKEWLDAHEIPQSEANLIYQYGRMNLRSEIRAAMYTRILDMVSRGPSLSYPLMYTWFTNKLWDKEKAYWQSAVNDKNRWQSNLCTWRPDADIAKQYNLNYDYTVWCGSTTLLPLFVAPLVPAKSYFLAAALKNVYGDKVGLDGLSALATEQMNTYLGAMLGTAAVPGVAAGLVAGTLVSAFETSLLPFGAAAVVGTEAAVTTGTAAGAGAGAATGSTSAGLGASAFAGPFVIVLMAIVIGVVAAFQTAEQEANRKSLPELDAELARVNFSQPDFRAWLLQPMGLHRISTVFAEATFPEYPSSAPLPERRDSDPVFVVTPSGGTTSYSNTFSWSDWFGNKFTAYGYGGWLAANGLSPTNEVLTSFSPTFQFRDWGNNRYTASRIGKRFLVTKAKPNSGDVICKADPATGVTPGGTNLTTCISYVTRTVPLKDKDGNNVSVSVADAPTFVSSTNVGFLRGSSSSFAITAIGAPTPQISRTSPLPPNMTMAIGIGNGKAFLATDGTTPAGTYSLDVAAGNSGGQSKQTLNISVSDQWAFTSPDSLEVIPGENTSFLVTTNVNASGTNVALTIDPGTLPNGLTFHDNGDGTALISGVSAEFFGTMCTSCKITATSATLGSITQTFQAKRYHPPLPQITDLTGFMVAGTDNTIPLAAITAPGYTALFGDPCGSLLGNDQPAKPSWLTITNNADGSSTLSGKPPSGSGMQSTYTFHISASNKGDFLPQTCTLTPVYSLTVQNSPAFTSALSATFTVGQDGYAALLSNQPPTQAVVVNGNLPAGVVLNQPFNVPPSFAGVPLPGSGGDYILSLTLSNSVGQTITAPFKMTVKEKPKILTPSAANFYVGMNNTFTVETTGFPKIGLPQNPFNGFFTGINLTLTPSTLPTGITFTYLTPWGGPSGTGVFAGNPPAGAIGTYPMNIQARNDFDLATYSDTQQFTLYVVAPGDVNADNVVNCADVSFIRPLLGVRKSQAGYNNRADVNSDGVIDIRDLSWVTTKLPTGTRCQ